MGQHPASFTAVEFDEGNETELAGHAIAATEAWEVLANEPTWAPNKKGRAATWLVVGRTDGGRALTLAVVYDESRGLLRPITGWLCTPGEMTKYHP